LEEVVHNLKEFIRKRGCIELDDNVMDKHKKDMIMYSVDAMANHYKLKPDSFYSLLMDDELEELCELYRQDVIDTRAIDWSRIERFLVQYNVLVLDEYEAVKEADEDAFNYINGKLFGKLSSWFAEMSEVYVPHVEDHLNHQYFMDEILNCMEEIIAGSTLAEKLVKTAKFVEESKPSIEHERYLYAGVLQLHGILSKKAFENIQYQFNQIEMNK
jgi:hypothetical protein